MTWERTSESNTVCCIRMLFKISFFIPCNLNVSWSYTSFLEIPWNCVFLRPYILRTNSGRRRLSVHSRAGLLNVAKLWVKTPCTPWEGRDFMCYKFSVWFCPAGSSLTLQQMVGAGLVSMAVVIVLTFLSFLAVWYVRLLFLRNEWNGGRMGLEAWRTAGIEEGQGMWVEFVLGPADARQAKGMSNSASQGGGGWEVHLPQKSRIGDGCCPVHTRSGGWAPMLLPIRMCGLLIGMHPGKIKVCQWALFSFSMSRLQMSATWGESTAVGTDVMTAPQVPAQRPMWRLSRCMWGPANFLHPQLGSISGSKMVTITMEFSKRWKLRNCWHLSCYTTSFMSMSLRPSIYNIILTTGYRLHGLSPCFPLSDAQESAPLGIDRWESIHLLK